MFSIVSVCESFCQSVCSRVGAQVKKFEHAKPNRHESRQFPISPPRTCSNLFAWESTQSAFLLNGTIEKKDVCVMRTKSISLSIHAWHAFNTLHGCDNGYNNFLFYFCFVLTISNPETLNTLSNWRLSIGVYQLAFSNWRLSIGSVLKIQSFDIAVVSFTKQLRILSKRHTNSR